MTPSEESNTVFTIPHTQVLQEPPTIIWSENCLIPGKRDLKDILWLKLVEKETGYLPSSA